MPRRTTHTLILLNMVPVTRNMARVSSSMTLLGDLYAQNKNSARYVTNGNIGRAASNGVRILPVLCLYELYIFTTTIGRLDRALACSRNSRPRPSGMPHGRVCHFQNSKVPNHVVRNNKVEPYNTNIRIRLLQKYCSSMFVICQL